MGSLSMVTPSLGSYVPATSLSTKSKKIIVRSKMDEGFCNCLANVPNPKAVLTTIAVGLLLGSSPSMAVVPELIQKEGSICQLAAILDDGNVLRIDGENSGAPFVMGGMTAKNFDPARYSGRWFEVASLKLGFAGQGQEDCHCTQGVYSFDKQNRSIQVDTFCVHGSPTGYITGIRGKVSCVSDEDLKNTQSDFERAQMIKEKCFLKFPTLPFIPKLPYNVIATDYENYALVSGAKDASFVQIYSRVPNPGPDFISKYKTYLEALGYPADLIRDTPQDCQVMSMESLSAMMSSPGMQQVMTNTFPDLDLTKPVQFDPFTSVFDTLKKLAQLYFK